MLQPLVLVQQQNHSNGIIFIHVVFLIGGGIVKHNDFCYKLLLNRNNKFRNKKFWGKKRKLTFDPFSWTPWVHREGNWSAARQGEGSRCANKVRLPFPSSAARHELGMLKFLHH
jgi:hypothetical protein